MHILDNVNIHFLLHLILDQSQGLSFFYELLKMNELPIRKEAIQSLPHHSINRVLYSFLDRIFYF